MNENEEKPKKPIPKGLKPFTSEYQPANKGVKPKFDYDSDEFYEAIFALAYQGMTDAEVADGLADQLGLHLDPNTFHRMKRGTYDVWSVEQNEYRGTRIRRVLERARRKVNAVVRNRYLKMALGGWKTKNVTTRQRRMRIDGELTDNEDIETSTSEIEYAPSLQALSVWLHHHDPEWRKYEGVVQEDLDADTTVAHKAKVGIDIEKWLDKEMEDKSSRGLEESDQDVSMEIKDIDE